MENESNYVSEVSNVENDMKPKNFGKTLKKLLHIFAPYKFFLIIALLFAAVSSLLSIIGVKKISKIADTIQNGIMDTIDIGKVKYLAIVLVIIYVTSAVISCTQNIILSVVTQKVSRKLRKSIDDKFSRLPMSYFYKHQTGDLLSRFTNDVDMLCESISTTIEGMVSSLMLFLGSVIMMFITSWKLSLASITTVLLGFIILALIISRSQKYFRKQQSDLGKIDGYIEEVYSGHTVVKAFSNEENNIKEFEVLNNELRKSNLMSQCFSGFMMPVMNYVGNLGYVAVCVVGAILTMKNDITFGTIVAFMMYINYFLQPLAGIGESMQAIQGAVAAGERVFEVLEEEEMLPDQTKYSLENVTGDVSFRNVRFGYDYPNQVIIKNFSLDILNGQKVAIVGETGAGKTTLVNLLMRFYEINEGSISIDNISIADVSKTDLRNQFAMVLQDSWVFDGTIRENLTLSDEKIENKQLDEVCKAAGIYHFIWTLPDNYDTELNEKVSLSPGQKQQLSIARAMLTGRKMLILDEATSSVDTRLERKIQNSMNLLMDGKTTFVIAHRLSTIINADRILVMSNGDIVESGTHDELMSKDGVYKELYNSQYDTSE